MPSQQDHRLLSQGSSFTHLFFRLSPTCHSKILTRTNYSKTHGVQRHSNKYLIVMSFPSVTAWEPLVHKTKWPLEVWVP